MFVLPICVPIIEQDFAAFRAQVPLVVSIKRYMQLIKTGPGSYPMDYVAPK